MQDLHRRVENNPMGGDRRGEHGHGVQEVCQGDPFVVESMQYMQFPDQDVRGFDKIMRPWHAYQGLDTTVKNMITSLRAVGELQNSAIRDRHWDQVELNSLPKSC